MQDVEITVGMHNFNGSLFQLNEFRQDAGPVVDAAWESMGVDCELMRTQMLCVALTLVDRSAIVPVEMAEQSGLTPSHVQVNPKYGGGFPANVEGLHHLHCLVSRLLPG